jgi:apolipoprotein N-acyltransferase
MTPYLAAIAGGVLMWAAFPPFDWGLLAFIAPAPLLWAVRRVDSAWAALGVGFLFGLVFFGAMLYWIATLGLVAWLPLTTVMASFMAVYAVVAWAFRNWPAGRWWLIVVALWGVWELVRGSFPLGGFPWGSLGYAAAGNPGFIGATQWIGPSGWSLLAVGVAAGLVLVIENTEHWALLIDPLVVAFMLMMAGGLFAPAADGPALQVAIVQGGSPCPGTHCPDENRLIFESHLELTQGLVPERTDLVVWPENAMGSPYEPEGNTDVRAALETEARRLDAYLLVSGTRVVDEDRFLNLNTFFGRTGSQLGVYAKRHPVPFGEFVPARSIFGFVPALDQVPRDMIRGDEPVVFPTDTGIIGSVISFEGAFPRYIRHEARSGAQLQVVATNESSYGRGPASAQLIAMTRVNAAAVGQDLIHAAITGESAIIRANGDIVAFTELLEVATLEGVVNFRIDSPTLYTRFGNWVLFVAAAAAAIAIVLPGGRRQSDVPRSAISEIR